MGQIRNRVGDGSHHVRHAVPHDGRRRPAVQPAADERRKLCPKLFGYLCADSVVQFNFRTQELARPVDALGLPSIISRGCVYERLFQFGAFPATGTSLPAYAVGIWCESDECPQFQMGEGVVLGGSGDGDRLGCV